MLSCVLALSPSGFGGVPRAVNSIAFLLLGPGVALATFLHRRYTAASGVVLEPVVVAVISETFSVTLLVLIGALLLLVGVWSVAAIVVLLTLVAVGVAVSPAGTVRVETVAQPEQQPDQQPSQQPDLLPAQRVAEQPPAPTTPAESPVDQAPATAVLAPPTAVDAPPAAVEAPTTAETGDEGVPPPRDAAGPSDVVMWS